MSNPTLERKLAAVKDLKAMYNIPSGNTWEYLKSQRAYEDVQAAVRQILRQAGLEPPEMRELANLCKTIMWSLEVGARDCIQARFGEDGMPELRPTSRPGKTYITLVFSSAIGRPAAFPDSYSILVVTPDYPAVVSLYQIFKNEIGKTGASDDTNQAHVFDTFMRELLVQKKMRFLELDGARYSFKSLLKQCGVDVKEWAIKNLADFNPRSPTPEETNYLLCTGETYNRAMAEKTLYRLETERRIALSHVAEFEYDIGEALRCLSSRTNDSRETLRKLEELCAPEIIIESTRKTSQAYAYGIRAIKLHRSWLDQVLSR